MVVHIWRIPKTTAEPERHPRNAMLPIWWDNEVVLLLDLPPPNANIIVQLYRQQMGCLAGQIKRMHQTKALSASFMTVSDPRCKHYTPEAA